MTDTRTQMGLGPLLAGLAAVILLVSLFLDWYEPGLSAWTAFEIIDLLLAAIALTILAAVVAALVPHAFRWRPSIRLWWLGALAFLLVTSQLINHPPAAQQSELAAGAWLAFGASLLALLAGLLSIVNVTLAVKPGGAAPRGANDPERGPVVPGAGSTTPASSVPTTGDTEIMREPSDPVTARRPG